MGFRKACTEGWIRPGAVGDMPGPVAYTDEVARPRPNTLALDRALFSSTQEEFPARRESRMSAVGQTSLPSRTPAKSVESEWTAIGRFVKGRAVCPCDLEGTLSLP